MRFLRALRAHPGRGSPGWGFQAPVLYALIQLQHLTAVLRQAHIRSVQLPQQYGGQRVLPGVVGTAVHGGGQPIQLSGDLRPVLRRDLRVQVTSFIPV